MRVPIRPAPAAPAPAAPATVGARLGALVLTGVGAGLVVLGCLFLVLVSIGVLTEPGPAEELVGIALGTAIIAGVPVLVGAMLFRWGVRRLNRVGTARA